MKTLLVVFACVAAALAEDKRVVGFAPARKGANPYMAAIFTSAVKYLCSGVLLNRSWIVTSARCVESTIKAPVTVVLGDYHLSERDGTEQKFEVYLTTLNAGYQRTNGYPNNIALLKLPRRVNINAAVRPLALPTTESFVGDACSIVGWGMTSASFIEAATMTKETQLLPNGTHFDVLNTARAIPITNDACISAWADVRASSVLSSHICAQNNRIQRCKDETASPLVCGNKLAGIASWGPASCAGTRPFVFTRVSSYASWINETISE